MLLLLLACADLPTEAPPGPSQPNRMDTAVSEAPSFASSHGGDGGGRAPTINGATITKPSASKSATLSMEVKDPDGGRTSARVQWYVNDVRVDGAEGMTLSPSHFRRGDKVSAVVTASDGENKREQKVGPVEVANSPPTFVTKRSDFRKIDGFQLKAVDPDGDTLSYRLEDAPPGMSISSTGKLSYSGSPSQTAGTYKTRIIVEDPEGEAVVWPLDLNIQAGSGG